MRVNAKAVESNEALELYVTAVPEAQHDAAVEAREMYSAIMDVVREYGARICRERVFVPDGQIDAWVGARRSCFELERLPVATDWLSAGPASGRVGGIQIHALRGPDDYKPLKFGNDVLGITFKQNGHRWALTSGLMVPERADAAEQSEAAFEEGEALLKQAGMDLHSVARTWLFMEDILSWYGEFNQTRNKLFIDRGLLKRGAAADDSEVPASTGIGVPPVAHARNRARVALEMFAVKGPEHCVNRYQAAGKQRAAYEYGSAFARASDAHTPAGRTIFVSGTAAIDEAGNTCHVGDITKQIDMTLKNVLAVMRDTKCLPEQTVQAIAYCKTPAVIREFQSRFEKQYEWPWVTVLGDVCRDDLLFEAEVTVCEAHD